MNLSKPLPSQYGTILEFVFYSKAFLKPEICFKVCPKGAESSYQNSTLRDKTARPYTEESLKSFPELEESLTD